MKKTLFRSAALVLVVGLALAALLVSSILPAGPALGQQDDPEVCLKSLGPGSNVILDVNGTTRYAWAGLFKLTIDDTPQDGWCLDRTKPIGYWCFNADYLSAPRETPWCEIGYILTNYSPTNNIEAAAIQLAIWKYMEGKDSVKATSPGAVETKASAMYVAAEGKCLSEISGDSQLELKPDGALNVTGSLMWQKFTATVSEPGIGPLQGIELKFETTDGSFNSTGPPLTSKTLSTNASGKASVTLYWNVSQSPFGATITVSTEGEWPVILYPTELSPEDGEIQRLIILEPFKLSEEDQVAWQQQLGGLKVTKSVEWGNVTPFNSTFEICIEGTKIGRASWRERVLS